MCTDSEAIGPNVPYHCPPFQKSWEPGVKHAEWAHISSSEVTCATKVCSN